MFAHQVIDSVDRLLFEVKDQNMRGSLRSARDIILSAQHFHLGDGNELFDLFKKHVDGEPLFVDNSNRAMRFPFEKCWFDYTYSNGECPKGGVAVKMLSEDLAVAYVFGYLKERKLFALEPFFNFFSINRPLSKEEILNISCGKYLTHGNSGEGQNIMSLPIVPGIAPFSEEYKNGIAVDFTVLHISLLLLSCKNISTEKHPAPLKLNKKRTKKGKKPIYSYHTLVIKPTGKKQVEAQAKGLWNNRIHLARGHFKTYTEEKPLFGRITGRFWWQPHVRGQNKDGVVMKDYLVEA